jgi:hypothetical protein
MDDRRLEQRLDELEQQIRDWRCETGSALASLQTATRHLESQMARMDDRVFAGMISHAELRGRLDEMSPSLRAVRETVDALLLRTVPPPPCTTRAAPAAAPRDPASD